MILSFADIDRVTPYTGRRARCLAALAKEGFPVPDGFVISADSYSRYMKEIEEELKDLSDENASQKASRILSILQNSRYPPEIEAETEKGYREMGMIQNLPKEAARFVMAGRDISNVAVRISNETELPLVQSFLNLRGTPEITTAIRRMFSVAFSRSMLHYKLRKRIPDSLFTENAVIVQKFIPGELFGNVMKHPFDDSKWIIEYCEAKDIFNSLLYGSTDPSRLVVDGLSMEILSDPASNRNDFAGGKYSVRKIIDYAEKAGAALDGNIMLELCVAKDRIWTIGAKPCKDFPFSMKGAVRKTPRGLDGSDIILLENCNVDIVPFIGKTSGILSRHGSYSSRLAMVCREMGVPFMICDRDFTEGDAIEIKNGEFAEEAAKADVITLSEMPPEPEKELLEITEALSKITPLPEPVREAKRMPEEIITPIVKERISPRITRLCIQIENLSQIKEAPDFDEVITSEPSIPEGSVGWMYISKEGDLAEFMKRIVDERKSKIIFDSFYPEKMKEIGQQNCGIFVRTPYDMLRTREISSVARLVIFDMANIARLLANSPEPVFDEVIMKQIATAMRYFRDHGAECYCSGIDADETTVKSLILMGADGIVTEPSKAGMMDSAIQKSERKILIDLARQSFKM